MGGTRSKLWGLLTIVVGITTTLLVMNYLSGIKQATATEPMRTVVVAAKKIAPGTLITSDMVKTAQVPTKYVHSMAITKLDSAVKQFAKEELQQDEVILSSQIESAKTSSQLQYKIPEGTRAITIATNPPSAVGGQIAPGDYVDVLVTYDNGEKDANGDKVRKASTVLQNILVLSVGGASDKKEGQPADTITLAVLPKDAETIALTENVGKLKLVLRPATEKNIPNLKSIDTKGLQSMYP